MQVLINMRLFSVLSWNANVEIYSYVFRTSIGMRVSLLLYDISGQRSADPPFSVQIESGPDLGSLIVSWLPVTITATGTSNGLHVKGYSVYVNGSQVKQLLSPTGEISNYFIYGCFWSACFNILVFDRLLHAKECFPDF